MSDESQRQEYYSVTPSYDATEHNHAFITIADVACDHQHGILGTTGPAIEKGKSHFHCIQVLTTSDPKCGPIHWHLVNVMTGLEIEVAGGEHTHQFCGETSCVLGHTHRFNSTTDTSVEEEEEEKCEHDYQKDYEREEE